jgi:hypothetical protein
MVQEMLSSMSWLLMRCHFWQISRLLPMILAVYHMASLFRKPCYLDQTMSIPCIQSSVVHRWQPILWKPRYNLQWL